MADFLTLRCFRYQSEFVEEKIHKRLDVKLLPVFYPASCIIQLEFYFSSNSWLRVFLAYVLRQLERNSVLHKSLLNFLASELTK